MVSREIVNKVEDAGLITLDLQDFIVPGNRSELDLAEWLDDGMIIKEVSFKKKLEDFNWEELAGSFVAVFCSKDVIIPPWAYLLVQTKLRDVARQVFFSDIHTMNLLLFQQTLNGLNIKQYENKRVFLKVCVGNKSIEDGILKQRLNASKKFDIKATPTLYINGEKYDGDLTFEALKLKINTLLN